MKMSVENGILYGGDIGSDEEICLHAKSLGEALMNAANRAGHRIVLVKLNICYQRIAQILIAYYLD